MIFQTLNILPNIIHILSNQRPMTSGYNELGIRKLRFVIIAHLLCVVWGST